MIHPILIADDHVIFRDGMTLMLNKISNVKVIGEASNGAEVIEILNKTQVDIVFMDIKMPVMDGIKATYIISEKFPNTKVIALTMFSDQYYIQQMIEAGAVGFMLKNADFEEIEKAIQRVGTSGEYFSPDVANILAEIKASPSVKEKHREKISISDREHEILKLICLGMSAGEISAKLNISPRTVDGHKANLLQKTNSKNTVSLILYSFKNNLISLK